MARPWTVMLNRGGMRSLVAMAMAGEPERLALLFVQEGRVSEEACRAAMTAQCEHYDAGRVMEIAMPHLVDPVAAGEPGGRDKPRAGQRDPLGATQLVLAACALACKINAERVIWPVQVGEDFGAVARVTETLMLIGQIVSLEQGREVAVETPLLEMTDRQLVEVGHQMSVPWEKARTCHAARGEPCGACDGCQRRNQAFTAAGLDDPLTLAHQAE